MNFLPQLIPEVFLIEPLIHRDLRGYFVETFKQAEFDKAIGYKIDFVQDNESKSIARGVLRGLHFQSSPHSQSKLVRVINGKVLDVAVDLRKKSKTFGHHIAVELSEENKKQLFIPREGIAYNDPDIKINWGFSEGEIILSEADKNYPTLANSDKLF